MKKYFLKNMKGSTVLLMTMIVLGCALMVVLPASEIVRNGIMASKNQFDSTKAYFAAEAGAERILWEIRNNYCVTNGDSQCFIFVDGSSCAKSDCTNAATSHLLSNSTNYRVKDEPPSGGDTKLTCLGTYQGVSRAIELSF
jgi:hypothetical protein